MHNYGLGDMHTNRAHPPSLAIPRGNDDTTTSLVLDEVVKRGGVILPEGAYQTIVCVRGTTTMPAQFPPNT